jgi:hypothetical protein
MTVPHLSELGQNRDGGLERGFYEFTSDPRP